MNRARIEVRPMTEAEWKQRRRSSFVAPGSSAVFVDGEPITIDGVEGLAVLMAAAIVELRRIADALEKGQKNDGSEGTS